MLRYETFNSGFSLKKYTFNPATVHSVCSFANLHSEIPRFLVWAAQGFSEVRGSLCSHVVFVMSPLLPPASPRTLSSVGFSLSMLVQTPGIWTRSSILFCLSFVSVPPVQTSVKLPCDESTSEPLPGVHSFCV